MTTVSILAPDDVGAARLTVFGPDGRVVVEPRLMLPTSRTLQFETSEAGSFTAKLEPVGDPLRLWSFDVGGAGPITVTAPAEQPNLAAPMVDLDIGVRVEERPIQDPSAAAYAGSLPLGFVSSFMSDGLRRDFFAGRSLSASGHSSPTRRGDVKSVGPFSVGLSYDSHPGTYGGWLPLADGSVEVRHKGGVSELIFPRQDEPLSSIERKRLRLSFALAQTKIQRILVPLFAGGVVVRIEAGVSAEAAESRINIVPSRLETRALLQALVSGSRGTAEKIWEDVSKCPPQLSLFGSVDVKSDPWVCVAVGLLMIRLGWLTTENNNWIETLAEKYDWVADASILAAYLRLAQTRPDVDGALSFLTKARKVGAVYFFEANRQQSDLLVSLAADAPELNQRSIAARELNYWRKGLANQVQVGPFFSWLMTNGARTRGGLDSRYSNIIDWGEAAGPV